MASKINKEVMQEIKMYQSQDYEIEEETATYYLMKKNNQSVGVHLVLAFCFWWLLFLPNIAYYFMAIKKKKIMK